MLEKLCCSAEAVQASIQHHMDREESDVFPLLELHLCEAQQRVLVYRTIRAMPLRLLERVMPWLVSKSSKAIDICHNVGVYCATYPVKPLTAAGRERELQYAYAAATYLGP